jgi:hypothetical protein
MVDGEWSVSHQPSAISHQPSAISHQPSAIDAALDDIMDSII